MAPLRFVVLHFLATGSDADVQHCMLGVIVIVGWAMIIKPVPRQALKHPLDPKKPTKNTMSKPKTDLKF